MPRIPGPQDVGQTRAPRDTGVRNIGAEQEAFAGVGNTVFEVADRLRQRRQSAEDTGFLAHISSQANKRFTQRFQEQQNQATEGAEQFPKVVDETLQEEQERLLREARTEQGFRPSEQALQRAQSTLASLRGNFGVKAATFENNARVEKMGREVENSLSEIRLQAFNDPDGLQEYLGQAKGMLDESEGLIPAGELAERKQDLGGEMAISAVNGLINERPREALERLQEGQYDQFLDAESKDKLIDNAGVAIRRMEVEERRNEKERLSKLQSQVRSRVEDEFASVQRTGERAGAVSDDMIRTAFPDTGDQIIRELETEQEFYNTRQSISLSTPDEDAQVLEENAPEGVGFKAEAGRQDKLIQALRDKYTQLGIGTEQPGDPVSYILENSPDLAQSIQESQEDPQAFQEATSRLLQEQRRLGVPRGRRRVMSDTQAANMVNNVESAPAEERAQQMAQLEQTFGPHFDRAFGEMVDAGLSAEMTVLGSVANDPLVSQQVSQLIQTPEKDLKEGLNNEDLRTIQEGVRDNLSDFFQAVESGDFTGASTSLTAKYQSVIERLAIQEFRRTGNLDSAIDRATDNVIGSRYDVLMSGNAPEGKGFSAYVPKTLEGQRVNAAHVEDVASQMQTRDRIEAFDPAPIGDPSAPEFVDKERIVRAASNSGFWVTNETGTGLVLMVPFQGGGALPVVNENGERYEVDFLGAMNVEPTPTESRRPGDIGQMSGRQF